MALIEQMICGRNPSSPDTGRTILARSPGIGAAVTDEIVNFCNQWGPTPPGGLFRPAILSFPLKATMPAIRGQLYAITRINTGMPAYFHAVVMSKADYRTFDYNPFAVVLAGSFLDSFAGEGRLAQGHIEPLGTANLFSPPPNPADVGLVDEALQQFLAKDKLVLKLDGNTPESDRVLSLLIHLMPTGNKEKLRFASFAPSGDNNYTLGTTFAKDAPFSSWMRLFMTIVDPGTPESVRKYVATVRNGLVVGDLGDVRREGIPLRSKPPQVESRPRPALEPLSTKEAPFRREGTPNRPPALSTGAFQTNRGPAKPATPMTSLIGGSGPGPESGMTRFPVMSSGQGGGKPSRTKLVRQSVPMTRRQVKTKTPAWLTFFSILLALGAGWVYLDRSGKAQEWGLSALLDLSFHRESDSSAPSLLEVVDVGEEYSRQLGKIQRAKLVPGSDRDQAMHRALADLQADAAGPLLIQAELFLQVADSGIQQGHRPDRERARLNSLKNQGQVLVTELGRLELAYYSFQKGILWQDLGTLPDAQVKARRDSLTRVARGPMRTISQEVGTGPFWSSLPAASKNVSGMAGLLTLFQAEAWSKDWATEMKRAAEKVSPTASPMSRAYRNNAFTLVRMKLAERQEKNLDRPFERPFGKGAWPSKAVRDILPELRRRAGLFSSKEMPALLSEVLVLYAGLTDPVPLTRKIVAAAEPQTKLEQNRAVKFDPVIYENYLARIRFEAMGQLLEAGTPVDQLPARLLQDLDPQVVVQFHQLLDQNENTADWSSLAAMTGDNFLGRWSRRQEAVVQTRTVHMREDIDRAWEESQVLLGHLMERAHAAEDWSSVWIDLQGELGRILAYSPSVVEGDSVGSNQWRLAADLKSELGASRPLDFHSVVVRLGPQPLPEPTSVFVEMQVDEGGQSFQSEPFELGPSAPEGSGWVGTANLDWLAEVSPADSFTARVRIPGQTDPLVEVHYPSLVERVGPGALSRTMRSDSGSLVFRLGKQWWRDIQLPIFP